MSLVLLWELLTLCVCAGTPKVWVQVQMAATTLPSFTVHCGFLGSGSISLVTMSWWGPNVTRGTKLAVLHPEFGVQQWAPARQARWLNESSVSLILEGAEARSPHANITFCCEIVSFPQGSHEACGDPLPSSDQGLPAPAPAPILQTDLAGILGASGVLLLGSIFILYLLRRQRLWAVTNLYHCCHFASTRARTAALHLPYPTTFCPAALDTTHLHQQLFQWAPVPALPTGLPVSAPSSFLYVENGLYARAGARPLHTGPSLTPFPDHVGAMDLQGRLGVQQHSLPN